MCHTEIPDTRERTDPPKPPTKKSEAHEICGIKIRSKVPARSQQNLQVSPVTCTEVSLTGENLQLLVAQKDKLAKSNR